MLTYTVEEPVRVYTEARTLKPNVDTSAATFTYRGRQFVFHGASRNDHILRAIKLERGFYEIDLLEYMLRIVGSGRGEGSISIDVGANIGNHTVFLGSFLTDKVIAVEPNPIVIPLLQKNVHQNSVDAAVYPVALSDSVGLGQISMPVTSAGNVGMAQVVQGKGSEGSVVELTTLDALVNEHRRKDKSTGGIRILKLDVEGMEVNVLRGATRLLIEERPHVFVEAASKKHLRALCELLATFGYQSVSRWAYTPVYHFVHRPPAWLRCRARALKLVSEVRRPIELRRAVRRVIMRARELL